MALRKALKVSASSTAQQAAEAQAQAALLRGAVLAGAYLEGPVAQEEAPGAATEQMKEEGPTPPVVKAHESDGAGAPPVAKAGSEAEAPGTSEAEVVEASAAGPVTRDTEMEVGQPLELPLA